jgi:hypothetical protein
MLALPALAAAPLFAPGGPAVRKFELAVTAGAAASLRSSPREYVRATLTVDSGPALEIGLHLKGSTGSFRPLDDRPSLTLDLNRFQAGQDLDGFTKLHLNNSVEDPSRLSEWLGHELFARAGIPSPQVAHARVFLNGRNLGVCVLKEGFAGPFVRRSFPNRAGSIWEPAPGQDAPTPISVAARLELAARPSRLAELVDGDQFMRLVAVEVLLAHRDGYALARNNFRVFQPADGGPAVFLPHGMDQLFATPTSPWRPQFAGEVARGWLDTPEGAARYEACIRQLLPVVLNVSELTNRLHGATERLKPHLNRSERRAIQAGTEALIERIQARAASLTRQLSLPPALDLSPGDSALLTGWEPEPPPPGAALTDGPGPDQIPSLRIVSGPATLVAWRRKVELPPGNYRLDARVATEGVKPLPSGRNQGACLRVAGADLRSGALVGTHAWQPLEVEFSVPPGDVATDLRLELRASAGEVRFAKDSLRITRLP